ncbi:hypothetical protein BDE36_2281 [Arcticibacter tournemirensis]|uniref:Uncharacterized protein n=1 Tax=Arcticibacter tournemirensis TaxID=699437 RepID=A0A4V1KIE5_9SPHI|nr:hypothetical protein [Arcticibacter tournemirensis]KAA8485011.1 hypothetical protein F1649_05095 [Arcticibacter tournemirensis]RXF70412.1 hypothetical protein EKH83_07095 [Arcticibacter tournemirensis]TQM50535.1 hypothetical protein BDE36_2281 [Arcticibacter tournemirensis]
MQTFEIKLFIDNIEQTLQVQEENIAAGTYIVHQDQKFIARIYKDTDGRWKTREVSEQSPSVIQSIGEETDKVISS